MSAKNVTAGIVCSALCIGLLAWLMPLAARAPFGGYRAEHLPFFPKTWGNLWALATEVPYAVGVLVVLPCLALFVWWITWEPEPKYRPRKPRSRPWLP